MWEKENRWLPQVCPFPTMFSKGFFSREFKSRHCVFKAYKVYLKEISPLENISYFNSKPSAKF